MLLLAHVIHPLFVASKDFDMIQASKQVYRIVTIPIWNIYIARAHLIRRVFIALPI